MVQRADRNVVRFNRESGASVSVKVKAPPNDAGRRRKYLARYQLDWRRLREQVSGV